MQTITDERRGKILDTCRQISILLEEIQPGLVPWAVNTGAIDRRFMKELEKIKKQARKFPEEWIELTLAQLATGSVFGNPERIKEYLSLQGSSPGPSLSPDAVRFLESLQDRPAFFTAFGVEKAQGDDLFEVRDYSSNDVHLLLSMALSDTVRSRPESFLTLLFFNGLCFQAIGPLHYYQALAPVDFRYYASLIRPDHDAEAELSAIMTAAPEAFVILDAFSEIPPFSHQGRRLYCCWSTFKAASVDPAALASSFSQEQAGSKMRFRLLGSEPPFAAADFYWDRASREAFIYTKGAEDYGRIVEALKGQLEAPAEPRTVTTQNMEIIAKALIGVEPPVIAWERAFEASEPPSPAAEAEIERLNALLKDLANAVNHGRDYDLQRLAARHGVSLENARQVEEMFNRQERSMDIDLPGELPGVPPVPPSGRMKMRGNLAGCPLFRFSTGSDAQSLFKQVAGIVESLRPPVRSQVLRTRTLLTLATLPAVLEEIDDPPWDDVEHTVLKYSMYLLCRAGGDYHSTEDYAAEILRLFWQILVRSRERPALRRFQRQYAIWCQELLIRVGLAEAETEPARPGAPFRLRATAFFKAWVTLGKTS